MSAREEVLYAFYDLAVNPNCFDIVKFVVLAELERRETGCGKIHFLFVPAPGTGFRADDQFEQDNREWRLRNIMMPVCAMIPACSGVTVCSTREEAEVFERHLARHVFPRGHSTENPVECFEWSEVATATGCGKQIPSIAATGRAREYIRRWMETHAGGRKVVSITLRELAWQEERNSRVADWLAFARGLDPALYLPIIIRDTDSIFEAPTDAFHGLTLFSELAVNAELRGAFYEQCYLNMMVGNGPIELCALNTRVPFLMFKVYPETWHSNGYAAGLAEAGVPPYGQLPMSLPHQRFVWSEDTGAAIAEAFDGMVTYLDSHREDLAAYAALDAFPVSKTPPRQIVQMLASTGRFKAVDAILADATNRGLLGETESLAIRGRARMLGSKLPEAVELLEKAVAAEPTNPHYHCLLGRAWAHLGNMSALPHFWRALQLSPGSPDAYAGMVVLGVAMERYGQLEDAETVWRDMIAKGCTRDEVYQRLLALLKGQGRMREAAELLMQMNAPTPVMASR